MIELTVTAEGQIVLRDDLLQHLGTGPGATIHVEKLPNGRIELRAARPMRNISDVFGLLEREGAPSLSIDEMNEVTAEGWAGERR